MTTEQIEAFVEQVRRFIGYADNMEGMPGHDDLLLKNHAYPCNQLSFCIFKHLERECKRMREYLDEFCKLIQPEASMSEPTGRCSFCKGLGEVPGLPTEVVDMVSCPYCGGTGKQGGEVQ